MTFSDAHVKAGKVAWRKSWELEHELVFGKVTEKGGTLRTTTILRIGERALREDWTPSIEDLFADDWDSGVPPMAA